MEHGHIDLGTVSSYGGSDSWGHHSHGGNDGPSGLGHGHSHETSNPWVTHEHLGSQHGSGTAGAGQTEHHHHNGSSNSNSSSEASSPLPGDRATPPPEYRPNSDGVSPQPSLYREQDIADHSSVPVPFDSVAASLRTTGSNRTHNSEARLISARDAELIRAAVPRQQQTIEQFELETHQQPTQPAQPAQPAQPLLTLPAPGKRYWRTSKTLGALSTMAAVGYAISKNAGFREVMQSRHWEERGHAVAQAMVYDALGGIPGYWGVGPAGGWVVHKAAQGSVAGINAAARGGAKAYNAAARGGVAAYSAAAQGGVAAYNAAARGSIAAYKAAASSAAGGVNAITRKFRTSEPPVVSVV